MQKEIGGEGRAEGRGRGGGDARAHKGIQSRVATPWVDVQREERISGHPLCVSPTQLAIIVDVELINQIPVECMHVCVRACVRS